LTEIVNPYLARYADVRYWVQDESNLSMKTILRRRITKCGVKPRIRTRSVRKGYSLYGAVEAKTGESFFFEWDRMNGDGFQEFLDRFSKKYPMDFHVIQADNAKFHSAAKLEIPENVKLLYQPPYSPEVNPIEQVWGWLKGKVSCKIFDTVADLKESVNNILESTDSGSSGR